MGFLGRNRVKHISLQSKEVYFWKWHSVTSAPRWEQAMEPAWVQRVEKGSTVDGRCLKVTLQRDLDRKKTMIVAIYQTVTIFPLESYTYKYYRFYIWNLSLIIIPLSIPMVLLQVKQASSYLCLIDSHLFSLHSNWPPLQTILLNMDFTQSKYITPLFKSF